MVILIPFLTQPPHERTLTGRGSRVYPNVGAAGCGLVGAGGVLVAARFIGRTHKNVPKISYWMFFS